jgi:type II secretory pathway component PulF
LFGFGHFAKDGLLVDISGTFPEWMVTVITTLLAVFFFNWLVFREANRNSWLIRPEFATANRKKTKVTHHQPGSAAPGKF